MIQYHEALQHVLNNGDDVDDRTGVGTRSVFGYEMRFDLSEGFPAVTTKRLAWKSVVSELLWFLEGSTDERRLVEILHDKPRSDLTDKSTIWTANADAQGVALGYYNDEYRKELGPVYGYQWRNAGKSYQRSMFYADVNAGFDQIAWLIKEIKENPDSRRLIVDAWDPKAISQMALPPCHLLAQFRVIKGKLSCKMYQRSADMFLGVPFNIASYALLTHMLASICDLEVGDFIWSGGDCHIYNNHFDQVAEQLNRVPMALPTLAMPTIKSLDALLKSKTNDYKLKNYDPMPTIKASMAV